MADKFTKSKFLNELGPFNDCAMNSLLAESAVNH